MQRRCVATASLSWPLQIQPCAKRFVHDWVTCPFSHPGEKAKRRDPRYFVYTGIACPSMKKVGTGLPLLQ
jgi:hypothetical protein